MGSFDFLTYTIPDIGQRTVRVFLPRGHDGKKARPALYMFDGQNVFDDKPSFAGGWHAHATVDKLSPRRFHVPAVVAIDHGGPERIAELGPWSFRGAPSKTDRLLDWMARHLVPAMESRYHLVGGPVGRAVSGSSMGGLAALYAHFRRPDVFGGAIAMSPSLWFGGARLLGFVAREPTPYVSRVYVDCGAREGVRMLGLARDLARQLSHRGYGADRLLFREDARGGHSERDWRRRLPSALRFMYRR